MALNTQLANATASAQATALGALLNSGYLRIYDGAQPATADTAITTQVLLAELRFANPAFGAAVNGVISANTMTAEDAALATGTAAWCRMLASDGTTVVMDGSVGVSSANLTMPTVSITVGTTVIAQSFTHTVPKGV